MFGPTPNSVINEVIDFNHREPHFFNLYKDTINLIRNKFGLNEYDIFIMSGSGTLTMESLIFSSRNKIRSIGPVGTFYHRWESLANFYNQQKEEGKIIDLYCAYETSISKAYVSTNSIVDAVCAFPYYPIPDGTIAFGTVSSKILGSAPLLGIVGVRKDKWDLFIDNSIPSYLNIQRYKEYANKMQTPFTPAYTLILNLKHKLEIFDEKAVRKKINKVSQLLVDYIGLSNIIGDPIGPAITIKKILFLKK